MQIKPGGRSNDLLEKSMLFLMPLGVPCEPNNAISESFLGALSDLGSVLGAILTMLGGQSHEK